MTVRTILEYAHQVANTIKPNADAPTVILLIGLQRFLVKGLSAGAVKG